MRPFFQGQRTWIRFLHHGLACASQSVRPVQTAVTPASGSVTEWFQLQAFHPKKPLRIDSHQWGISAQLKCLHKWFDSRDREAIALSTYFRCFQDWPFPYELTTTSPNAPDTVNAFTKWLESQSDTSDRALASTLDLLPTQGKEQTFHQLHAPLRLLIKALQFNRVQKEAGTGLTIELYIAQSLLEDLPQPLKDDVPVPQVVKCSGRGDVYSSSIWMGTEPTYTPLHRDPNPNLFFQLHGTKVVRLMPPAQGQRLYMEVQHKLGRTGNSRIRTTDMMEGSERNLMHEAVWSKDSQHPETQEAELHAGQALFIPEGFWHSVRSKGSEGGLNASVNWWFR
ncbi:hypothetical protein HIM_04350 [Hirsutella minnesotensis 3608]|uniref:JmjC domain-containing protein n=1 Tax=Hirsutella minnesotensis 3608 TaxID=1043627 RepID=A0A0F7ZVA4_9HYPO|nr:hypothetical protein HIM_04350 [Hirsutella minnesotensis 3608]